MNVLHFFFNKKINENVMNESISLLTNSESRTDLMEIAKLLAIVCRRLPSKKIENI